LTKERLSLGRAGEDAAACFLEKKGFRLLQRNFRCRMGELDIIARDDRCLVFVEVRTVAGNSFGPPQESVGIKKQFKLRQLAQYYLQTKYTGSVPARFDVVAVTMGRDGRVVSLEHIINAF